MSAEQQIMRSLDSIERSLNSLRSEIQETRETQAEMKVQISQLENETSRLRALFSRVGSLEHHRDYHDNQNENISAWKVALAAALIGGLASAAGSVLATIL